MYWIVYSAVIKTEPKTKKNSQKIIINKRTRRPMLVQSEDYLLYERQAGLFLPKLKEPINQPVNIRAHFYRRTRHRVDLTNLLEALDDILVKNKIIADDDFKIVMGHDGSRVYIDKDNPRTEV